MRRSFGWVLVAVLAVPLLGACGSDGHDSSSSTSSVPRSSTAATTTLPPSTSTTTATTLPPTSTSRACPTLGSTAPLAPSPSAAPASVLRKVTVTGQGCTDRVAFGFRPEQGPPQCTVNYAPGPFSQDASGRPVTVAGTAFLVVRCEPASSLDALTGKTTYVAPKGGHTAVAGTQHVTDLVATGDFEGVMSWVIGLDGPRPFVGSSGRDGALVVIVY